MASSAPRSSRTGSLGGAARRRRDPDLARHPQGEAVESEDWRRAIARELARGSRSAERLLVASPLWRRAARPRSRARGGGAGARRGARRSSAELADRLLPTGGRGADWPLGQDVTAMAVGGWIRRLDGVAAVTELALLDAKGRPIASGTLTLARNELPRLEVGGRTTCRSTGAVR